MQTDIKDAKILDNRFGLNIAVHLREVFLREVRAMKSRYHWYRRYREAM